MCAVKTPWKWNCRGEGVPGLLTCLNSCLLLNIVKLSWFYWTHNWWGWLDLFTIDLVLSGTPEKSNQTVNDFCSVQASHFRMTGKTWGFVTYSLESLKSSSTGFEQHPSKNEKQRHRRLSVCQQSIIPSRATLLTSIIYVMFSYGLFLDLLQRKSTRFSTLRLLAISGFTNCSITSWKR